MHCKLLTVTILLGLSQAAAWAQEGREQIIPLFMAADDALDRQGFLRVINHSDRRGVVQIFGYDDAGRSHGPVALTLDPGETQHLNSNDLENGNTSKGLASGLGNGTGYWRLVFRAVKDADGRFLDVEPLAYFRNRSSGFLASLNDVASEAAMHHRVAIFNPGSNPNQLSWLRVVNLGDTQANVTISGVDDAGRNSAGNVRGTVPPGGAMAIDAVELEQRGLGDGMGKWTLRLSATQPVQVMSLLDVPGGYLSNLSGTRSGYRGATGLWELEFSDDSGDAGYIILLPDSRLYAWLPDPDGEKRPRILRGTFHASGGVISGQGDVYESGKIGLQGFNVVGGADPLTTFAATFASGDWIRGEYAAEGDSSPRQFSGTALGVFGRGGSTAAIASRAWSPSDEEATVLPEIMIDNAVSFADDIQISAGSFQANCDFGATLSAENPAFAVFQGEPTIDCGLLRFEKGEVELVMSLMDDRPGEMNEALMLVIAPGNEVAFGALYELED